jgi:hypothetical protein
VVRYLWNVRMIGLVATLKIWNLYMGARPWNVVRVIVYVPLGYGGLLYFMRIVDET